MSEALINRLYDTALNSVEHLPQWLMLLTLFAGAVLQIIVPPVPGDALLPTMGALSSALALPHWGIVYFLGYWVGTYAACVAVLEASRAIGDRVLKARLVRKLLRPGSVAFPRRFLKRHGGRVLLATKFIPGVNTPALIMAGVMNVPRAGCLAAIAAATLLQNGVLFVLGRVLGSNFSAIVSTLRGISTVGLYLMVLAMVLAGFGYGRLVRRRLKGRMPKSVAAQGEENHEE